MPVRPSPRRKKRSPALNPARILDAALAVIQEDGVAGFSTRKLGERLGCEAMSIYHHFPSKGHLLDGLVDRAIGSIEWPPKELPPLERVRRSAEAYRAMANRHAALYPFLAVHRLNTETGVRFIEEILSQVHAVVRDDEKAARHFRSIGYFLTGAGLDETSGYAKGPSAQEPVSNEFIARECPHLARAARYFQRGEWNRTFELGLDALMDALARDAPKRR